MITQHMGKWSMFHIWLHQRKANHLCVFQSYADRSYPHDISIVPEDDGSSRATVSWSFAGTSMDLSHFRVTVKVKDIGIIFLNSTSDDERSIVVENLKPLKKHEITVAAVYTDEIEKVNSVDFFHTGMHIIVFCSIYVNKLFLYL